MLSGCSSGGCKPMHRFCWVHCRPLPIHTLAEAGGSLRAKVNGSLKSWQTAPAFVFTPFKRLGISGWHDYCLLGELSGEVIQSSHSSDGFQTVDFLLLSSPIPEWSKGKYIRVEIMPDVLRHLLKLPAIGERYSVVGELVWDGDGWLEIHPQNPAKIVRLQR